MYVLQRDHKIGIQNKRETAKLHQWRGLHVSIIQERKIMDDKRMDLFRTDFSGKFTPASRLWYRKAGVKRNKNNYGFYTNLPPRMSVLGILWSTDTGICFLLECSYPRSYTARLRKGLVFYVKAELLLSARFKRYVFRIKFPILYSTSIQFHNEY